MAIITVADVLKHAEKFEEMLVEYFDKLGASAEREGVRLLTQYMSRHRLRINAAFESVPPEVVKRVCRTPLRYEPQAADCRCFVGMELPPELWSVLSPSSARFRSSCLGVFRGPRQTSGSLVSRTFTFRRRAPT